jgi:hypothetical protein
MFDSQQHPSEMALTRFGLPQPPMGGGMNGMAVVPWNFPSIFLLYLMAAFEYPCSPSPCSWVREPNKKIVPNGKFSGAMETRRSQIKVTNLDLRNFKFNN